MTPASPEPRDHSSVERYPDAPTEIVMRDGVRWRVAVRNEYDDAMPVPVTDLMQAIAVLGVLNTHIDNGSLSAPGTLAALGRTAKTNVPGVNQPTPTTAEDVSGWLRDLRQRLKDSMPHTLP